MAPPFFIVGNDRSGTTMLRLVLDRGPEVAIPPESMFLADFADVRRAGGLGDRARAQAFAGRVWAHPKVRLWGLRGAAPEVPPGLAHEDAYRFAVEAPYRAYAALHGKPRWADKTPPYVHLVDELLAVWPDARVVVLVRDGRDVALSVRPLPFGPNNAWAAADWWARGVRAGQRAAAAHPGQVLTVRYEDLVADPERRVREVCEAVGLAFAPEMLDLGRADRSKVVPDERDWFPTLWGPITSGSVGRWRTGMSPRERRVFSALAGPALRELGYDDPHPGARPPSRPGRLLLHLHNESLRNLHFVRLRVLQEGGRELRWALRRKVARALGRSVL